MKFLQDIHKVQKCLLRRRVLMSFTMLLCGEDSGGGGEKKKSSTLDKLDGEVSYVQNQNAISRTSYLTALVATQR